MEVEYTDGSERMEIPTMMEADESQHEKINHHQTRANVAVREHHDHLELYPHRCEVHNMSTQGYPCNGP